MKNLINYIKNRLELLQSAGKMHSLPLNKMVIRWYLCWLHSKVGETMQITIKNKEKCEEIINKAVEFYYKANIPWKFTIIENIVTNYIYDYNTFKFEDEEKLIPLCVDIAVQIINSKDKILKENLYNIEIKRGNENGQ